MTVEYRVLVVPIVLLMLPSCLSPGESESFDPTQSEEFGQTGQGLSGPSEYFRSYSSQATDGVAQVERFVECEPDEVMTGFGARVDSDNVTDVTLYCRAIQSDGSLNPDDVSYYSGGDSQQQKILAGRGQVVVGLGGSVTNDSIERLVIWQCPWIATDRRVDTDSCSYKSTEPFSDSTEVFLNLHATLSASAKERTVGVGAGITATDDNMYAVRMISGYLE